jgi:HK97 family phage prohead protease
MMTRTEPRLDYLAGLQVRAATGLQLEVTALAYGSWYPLAGTSEERFVRGCFGDLSRRVIPLLVSHDHASLPVGRAISWDDSATHLRGKFQLIDSARGCEIYDQVRAGFVAACSIGFQQPIDGRVIETRGAGLKITRHSAVLREISLVGVGQISDAVVSAVPAGMIEQPAIVKPVKVDALVPAMRTRPPTPQRDSWNLYRRTLDRDCAPLVKRSIVTSLRTGPVRGPWDFDRL